MSWLYNESPGRRNEDWMEEKVRKERMNLIGVLKLKQLNDPSYLNEPKGFEFEAS